MITRIKNSVGFRATRWHEEQSRLLRHKAVSSSFEQRGEIHTYTTPDELLMLADFAARVPSTSAIVEIGSYIGASTRYLVHGSRQAGPKIVCIDTWMNETMPSGARDTFEEFKRNMSPHSGRLTILRSESQLLARSALPESIGLAFIDGDHTYAAVKTDLSLILPNICPGGYIAFHDIAAFRGVSQCVGELMAQGNHRVTSYTNNLIILRSEKFDK